MKFKFLLAALAISAFVSVPAQAQDEMETRHEIGISYGAIPNSTWIDVLTEVIPAMFGETYDNHRYVGPIGLEYYYHTSPLIGVGAVVVYATNNEDGFEGDLKTSHLNKSYFTVMPSAKFNWLRKKHWGLYSKLAIGATYAHFVDQDYDQTGKKTNEETIVNDLLFNFQASVLGVEAGSQKVRGFVELGVGEQGLALAGIRFKF